MTYRPMPSSLPLQADAIAAVKSARIYPYFRVIDCVDNTAANAVKTSGYGIHQSITW